jgi:hypothetical protein
MELRSFEFAIDSTPANRHRLQICPTNNSGFAATTQDFVHALPPLIHADIFRDFDDAESVALQRNAFRRHSSPQFLCGVDGFLAPPVCTEIPFGIDALLLGRELMSQDELRLRCCVRFPILASSQEMLASEVNGQR